MRAPDPSTGSGQAANRIIESRTRFATGRNRRRIGAEEQLTHEALHDPLTGLWNRRVKKLSP